MLASRKLDSLWILQSLAGSKSRFIWTIMGCHYGWWAAFCLVGYELFKYVLKQVSNMSKPINTHCVSLGNCVYVNIDGQGLFIVIKEN